MDDHQLLAALLATVRDLAPLERQPPLAFQVSIVGPSRVLLWDARPDADEGIASAIAGQFGTVVATAVEPMLGILIEANDTHDAAIRLLAAYAAAETPRDAEPPF